MSKLVVGVFDDLGGARAAEAVIASTGRPSTLVAAGPDGLGFAGPLLRRGDILLRTMIRWGVIGALIIEAPWLIALLMLPVDTNVKVFLAATVWKVGAIFGAWFGVIAAEERGLLPEHIDEYERHLADGRCLLAADVRWAERPHVRGAMLESGATDVRDVVGTFEPQRVTSPHVTA
jgi:hypothetical protein